MKRPLGLGIALSCLSSACAFGHKFPYDKVMADLRVRGNTTVAVTVHDQREAVLSGKHKPTWCGFTRAGAGIPYAVTTESGRPVAHDITQAITQSLARNGFRAAPVFLPPNIPPNGVAAQLGQQRAQRAVLLTLYEWKTDTYTNTIFVHDVVLKIFDERGTLMVELSSADKEDLGGSFMNPPKHAKQVAPVALKARIEELFSFPEVFDALGGPPQS